MMHIKHLEDEIMKDIAAINSRGGYKNMMELRGLKDQLELWELLHKFEKHHSGGHSAHEETAPRTDARSRY